jgi:hypothetical protein
MPCPQQLRRFAVEKLKDRRYTHELYRRRYTHELDKKFNSTKTNSMRYAGHKSRRPTTKCTIQSQTQWKEKSRKTKIQVGGWGEQR